MAIFTAIQNKEEMKILGITMAAIGIFLIPFFLLLAIGLVFKHTPPPGSDPAFAFGYTLGGYLFLIFSGFIIYCLIKYGLRLIKRKNQNTIINRDIDSIGE